MRFTEDILKKLKADGKIQGYTIMEKKQPSPQLTKKDLQDKPLALQKMDEVLRKYGIAFVCEHRFHKTRKFRFDRAIVDLKIAFEYEGLMSKKSRHTTVTGFTRDATKYNLAQSLGWRVYRYTVLNHTEIENDLLEHLKNNQ